MPTRRKQFFEYLRQHNVVEYEDRNWLVIQNIKYHSDKRMWLTAFAKREGVPNMTELQKKWGDREWLKKPATKQSIGFFHIHIYE